MPMRAGTTPEGGPLVVVVVGAITGAFVVGVTTGGLVVGVTTGM
jgi:hypothetical protein